MTFESLTGVKEALKLHKSYMGKRYCEVVQATGHKTVERKSNNIFDYKINLVQDPNKFIKLICYLFLTLINLIDNVDDIPEDCNTIFVKGLPYTMSENALGELC